MRGDGSPYIGPQSDSACRWDSAIWILDTFWIYWWHLIGINMHQSAAGAIFNLPFPIPSFTRKKKKKIPQSQSPKTSRGRESWWRKFSGKLIEIIGMFDWGIQPMFGELIVLIANPHAQSRIYPDLKTSLGDFRGFSRIQLSDLEPRQTWRGMRRV